MTLATEKTNNMKVKDACAAEQLSGRAWNQVPLFQVFVFLQVLDLLTTIVVLKLGGYEANPLVSYFMTFGPTGGLVMAKAIVIVLGTAIVWYNRHRVVFFANYAYAGIVCWNLAVLAIG
jgi:hypothetical protein